VPETRPRILVSDTVGFIKKLPHGLVASFKSTLAEALEASLLAHVVDASDPGFERQLEVTAEVLDEIGAGDVPRLLVFNKIDRLGDDAARKEAIAALSARWPDALVMSAKSAADVARLHAVLRRFFTDEVVEAELRVPWDRQRVRGEIFAACEVVEERAEADAAVFRVRADRQTIARLGRS
jgi:GTP-binding protein HflX